MHSLLGVDEKGKAITPCITWADNRAANIAAGLRQHQQQLYHLTGTPLHAMTPLAKLIWLKKTRNLRRCPRLPGSRNILSSKYLAPGFAITPLALQPV